MFSSHKSNLGESLGEEEKDNDEQDNVRSGDKDEDKGEHNNWF